MRQASPELQAFVTSALVGVHAEGVAGVLAALASAGCTELVARTVSMAEQTRLQVSITRDGQPWWERGW